MSETLSTDDETITAEPETGLGRSCDHRSGAATDLRRVGINPNFWYPVAVSGDVRKKKTFAATFAGERIALYRGDSGTVYALEDRCAHRQVPLSMGVVEGDVLRCCYHAWAYRGNGRISQIPYLPRGAARPPRGVRSYPVHEAYGLVFVFPGDPHNAAETALPELPEFNSARHKTMTFSRTVGCHYSFMHENLLDMNHQFLHRGVVGRIQPTLLGYDTSPHSVEARYRFTHAGGKKNRGAGLLAAKGAGGTASPDVITIRTAYPYQTLQLVPENAELPAFSLWVAYVPEDAEQRTNHVYGLLDDREAADPWSHAPRLAAHPPLHRARIRRRPDSGRSGATSLGRARRGLEPRGVSPHHGCPPRAPYQRRPPPSRIRPVGRRCILQQPAVG